MRSAIYEGEVWHRRLAPRSHEFRYKVAMPYIDLSEMEQVLRMHPFWSARRGGPMQWREQDYLPGPGALDKRVRERVVELGRRRPDGPVVVLANWRTFGWAFNPLSLYYCFGGDGRLEAVLGEVTNTPWGERQSYLFGERGRAECMVDKEMHVSPFCGMDQTYRVCVNAPSSDLGVRVDVEEAGSPVILAELALKRRELSRASMSTMLARHPAMAFRVSLGIYRQAASLLLKGVPYHPHPVCPMAGEVGSASMAEVATRVSASREP